MNKMRRGEEGVEQIIVVRHAGQTDGHENAAINS